MQSAPVTSAGVPGGESHKTFHDEKDLVFGATGEDAIVSGANDVYGEDEPTAEEMSTLRKVPAAMPWPVIAMCLIGGWLDSRGGCSALTRGRAGGESVVLWLQGCV
jgi:hypothetical protein